MRGLPFALHEVMDISELRLNQRLNLAGPSETDGGAGLAEPAA